MANEDLSLEPLFNQSSEGSGADKKLAFVPINAVGAASHGTEETVTDTAEEITITVGKRSIEIHNSGEEIIYYGGSGVTSSVGIPVFPRQTKPFSNVKDDFSIYIVAASGANSTRRIVEYA